MVNERARILIIGYGEMGQAMAHLLRPSHEVRIWQRRTDAGPETTLPVLAASADILLFCVPTAPHLALARRLQPVLTSDALCVSIAKGLDDDARPAQQILHEALPTQASAVMHGPMIAEALRAGEPGFAQVGTRNPADFQRLQSLFVGTSLYLRHSADAVGLGWAAALKNVYAIAFGAVDEWQLGDNVRGFLAATAVAEMEEIIALLGGDRASARGLAGLGDLITTGTSLDSRHHEAGRRLARGEGADRAAEGVHTLERIQAVGRFDVARFRLCRYVEQGVVAGRLRRDALLALFADGR